MDGYILELGVLAFRYMAKVIKLVTTSEGLRMLRRAVTLKNIFSIILLLFFIYECGSQDAIDSFFDFFSEAYLFSMSDDFKDILTILGAFIWALWVDSIRYPLQFQQINQFLGVGFNIVHTHIWVFFSLWDGHHVGREPDKNKPKKRFGVPRALRPPTIDGRPQITPQQSPGEEVQQRSSSGTSGSGERKSSGEKKNGYASGWKRGKGKKRR